jgi:hypothetical protein
MLIEIWTGCCSLMGSVWKWVGTLLCLLEQWQELLPQPAIVVR